MSSLRVGLIQLHPSHSIEKNISSMERFIFEAKKKKCDLVLLPEYWLLPYCNDQVPALSVMTPALLNVFSVLARKTKMYLMVPLIEQHQKKYFSSLMVFSDSGKRFSTYRKRNIFSLNKEGMLLHKGTEIKIVTIKGFTIGLNICFDLRFVDQSVRYKKANVDMLVYPAQWGSARIEHWKSLLTARAIEHQAYVIGCNCTGKAFGGQSRIVDPTGKLQLAAGVQDGVFVSSCNSGEIQRARKAIPLSC